MIIYLVNKFWHLSSVLLCIHFFYFFCSTVNASDTKETYFEDNFDTDINTNWNVYNDGGSISYDSNGLTLSSSNSRSFPFLNTKANIFPESGNYELEIKYSFPSTSDFGVGFGMGNFEPVYGISSINDPNEFVNWIYFHVWQGRNDNYGLYGRNCVNNNSCQMSLTKLVESPYNDVVHTLNVVFLNDHFDIFHDGLEVSNAILSNSLRRPNSFWIGNPVRLQTSNLWTSLNITHLKVSRLIHNNDIKTPVIILPGFGGSWDVGAILEGKEGTSWQIPEFVKEYDGVINSFKNAGFVEGTDLFVFPYDWRKSLSNLATDLNKYIIDNGLADKEINLVGHSMGGLVARTYLQNYNNPKVNKIIMAGSPNKGIVDAYNLWEGAMAGDSVWWQKVLLEIASEVNRKTNETKIESLRRVAPSVKDLMPTENFLLKNSISKPWNALVYKNDFLAEKNNQVITYLPKLFAGASNDYSQTKSAINIEEPSVGEKLQGLWVDGKPKKTNTYLFSSGDGYVNKNSSQSLFDNKLNLSGGHGDTISKKENIVKILSELGVATESAVGSTTETKKKSFVAKLNSPGKIHVCLINVCDSDLGFVFESEKMIIVPVEDDKKYSITIDANGETGSYNLLLGEINDLGEWRNIDGKLTLGTQRDNYFYDCSTNELTADIKTLENNIKIFWPKKIKSEEINDLRENILEDIDKNIKKNNILGFDLDIAKWKLLDVYVTTTEKFDKESKHFEESKYLKKTNNYFAATIAELLSETTQSLNLIPSGKHKLREDKQIQIGALRKFLDM